MAKPITGKITTSTWRQKRKNGDIYVWERKTKYVPETRKTKEISRKLLGKIPSGSIDGKIVPTRPKRPKKERPNCSSCAARQHIGVSKLLSWVGKESGITEDLLSCTDIGTAQKIETIAQFWLTNQGERLKRMEKWQKLHPTPYAEKISKDVYHDLFEQIGMEENLVQGYFKARANRCDSNSPIAFDSTTISSYSTNIHEARQGFNKAGDGLNTVKLLTLYDLKSHQPIAFAKQPGNLSDVAGIENALKQMSYLNVSKAQLVTDSGYYSQDNLCKMVGKHMKFLTAVSIDLSWVNKKLQENRSKLKTVVSQCPWELRTHGFTIPIQAEFAITRQRSRNGIRKGETVAKSHRLYLHLYLSKDRRLEEEERFGAEIFELKRDIEMGLYDQLSESAKKRAAKYLIISRVGRGGKLRVEINEDASEQAKKDYGYFALISNKAGDCFEALKTYRLREKIEEAFKDTKNRIDGHRTRVWDGDTLKGRMFCQFVGLGYYCFLRQKIKILKESLQHDIQNTELEVQVRKQREVLLKWLNKQTMQSLLDWLDCIEITSYNSVLNDRCWDTKRDRMFFTLLGVPGFEEKPKSTLTV